MSSVLISAGNWPATAYIKFEYKVEIKLENNGPTYQIGTRSSCSGFLIDASTVLTAAHCLLTKVDVNLKNNSMSVPVVTNQFHKTYESMFTGLIYSFLYIYGQNVKSKTQTPTKTVLTILTLSVPGITRSKRPF